MALCSHNSSQQKHLMHFLRSTSATSRPIVIAERGHISAHLPHKVHSPSTGFGLTEVNLLSLSLMMAGTRSLKRFTLGRRKSSSLRLAGSSPSTTNHAVPAGQMPLSIAASSTLLSEGSSPASSMTRPSSANALPPAAIADIFLRVPLRDPSPSTVSYTH